MHNLHQLMQAGFRDQVIIQCTAEDLATLVKRIIEDTRQMIQDQYEYPYWSVDDIMQQLHIARSTVYAYARQGILEAQRINGKLLFRKDQVKQEIKKGTFRRCPKHTPYDY